MPDDSKTCFVVMPISDSEDYDTGHFGRVYSHLIKPACVAAGYEVIRADDVRNTNFIILDILKRIISAEIVVVDLSSKNPNVMYELGIRQAFDLPVVLVKDRRTERVFDIQGLRTIDYDESLRIDAVARDLNNITNALKETADKHDHDSSSLIRLLSLAKAELQQGGELSEDTAVILSALGDLSERITRMERPVPRPRPRPAQRPRQWKLPSGYVADRGDELFVDGESRGELVLLGPDGIVVQEPGGNRLLIPQDHDDFAKLSPVPF